MWLPTPEILGNPALNSDTLFVVQAWRELLDPRSPDTYRARALDPFLLLDELLKVSQLAKSDQKWLSHVQAICEEIRDEEVAFFRLPVPLAAKHAFATLGKFGNAKHDDLHRIKEAASLAKTISGAPLQILLGAARSQIANGLQQKADFLRTLGAIATHAHRLGVSDAVLLALEQCDFTAAPENALDLIAAELSPELRTFHCFLAVSGSVANLDSLLAGSEFSRIGLPRIERQPSGAHWHATHAQHYLAEIAIDGRSSRLAAEGALARLESLLNLLALYANAASHTISNEILIEDGDQLLRVDVSPAKHYGLFPRNGHIETTRARIQQLGNRLDGRIANLLGAHAMGISAADPRAALSHFWTSLEAIVGDLGPGSIGERVASVIAPIVTSRRIHKIVTYLALSIYEAKRASQINTDLALMPSSTTGHVSREDVLSCLTGARDNPGILDLFRICSRNPLLCYHLLRAWEELSDPRELAKTLKRSEQRVKWQILRIYRARNIFVHKGGNDELAWRLLENAQSYISFVVGRVMYDMSLPHDWTIDAALEFERQHFERLVDCLARLGIQCGLKTSDLLPHLTARGIDVPLWGVGSRFGN